MDKEREEEEDRVMMETILGVQETKVTMTDGESENVLKKNQESLKGDVSIVTYRASSVSNLSSMGSGDYLRRLQFGGNIYNEEDLSNSAKEVAKNFLWPICKFIVRGDKEMVVYRGKLCELMIMYTCKYKPIYKDLFKSEETRKKYWEVAAPIIGKVLFRKRSTVSTAIRKYFMGKYKRTQ